MALVSGRTLIALKLGDLCLFALQPPVYKNPQMGHPRHVFYRGFHMKFVNLALDILFRTLDTIDAVRDRIDDVMGQSAQPEPWAVKWPASQPPAHTSADVAPTNPQNVPSTPTISATKKASKPKKKAVKKKTATKKKAAKKKPATKKKTAKKKPATKKKTAKKKPATKKKTAKKKPATKKKSSTKKTARKKKATKRKRN
jgi:hypothetical protein